MMCHRWSQTLDSVSTYFSFNTSDWTYGFGQELCYWVISAGFLFNVYFESTTQWIVKAWLNIFKACSPWICSFPPQFLLFIYLFACLLLLIYLRGVERTYLHRHAHEESDDNLQEFWVLGIELILWGLETSLSPTGLSGKASASPIVAITGQQNKCGLIVHIEHLIDSEYWNLALWLPFIIMKI